MLVQRLRHTWLPISIFSGFLLLYTTTLVQGVSTADNAEFQWVGATLGLAHPPGFPLYTLLSNLMTQLPFSASPAYKINLLSAITSSLTLVFVYLAAYRMTTSKLAGLLSALALGTATTFWAQATVANVRSLTALFAAIAYYLLFTVYCSQFTGNPSPQPSPLGEGARPRSTQPHSQFTIHNSQLIILFALTVGFGFTHHLSLTFIFLVMLLWLLWLDWRMWKYLPFGLLGLLPWLYLPLASAELRTPSTFLTYALGLGFGGDFFAFNTASELWTRAGVMLNVLTFQMHPILLLAALAGWLILLWRKRPIAILLGATFFIHTFITATYRAPQTVEYMLPAYVPLVLMMGGLTELRGSEVVKLRDGGQSHSPLPTPLSPLTLFTVYCLLFTALCQGYQRLDSFRFLATSTDMLDYTNNLFEGAPDDVLVLSNWHWFTALRYRQVVEGIRPDLQVEYVVPQGESYAANWVAKIEAGLAANTANSGSTPRPIITTNHYPEFATLPATSALGDAFLWHDKPITELPNNFRPLTLTLGNAIAIDGYRQEASMVLAGESTRLFIAWRPLDQFQPANLFIHLVDESGQIVAQQDLPAMPQPNGLTITQFDLTPQRSQYVGRQQLFVGAYGADGTPLLDQNGEQRTYFDVYNVIGASDNPQFWPANNTSDGVPLGEGLFWTGNTTIDNLQAGDSITVRHQFVSTRPIMRDLAVSMSMVGFEEDGVTWAWRVASDGIPATGAIPTLKWIEGSRIIDPHTLTVPDEAYVGQTVKAWVTVYDAFTNRPIPVLDPEIRQQEVGIPLFELTIGNEQ